MALPAREGLVAELGRLNGEKRSLQRAIRAARAQRRREAEREAACGCSAAVVQEAVAVFCLTGYNRDQAELCLCVRGGARLQGGRQEWYDLVVDAFLEWAPEDISCLSFPTAAWHHALRRKAQRFDADYSAVQWVQEQNDVYRLAPTAREVRQEFQAHMGLDAEEVTFSTRRAQRFARKLIRDWRLGFRKLQVHEDTTPNERAQMVRASIVSSRPCAARLANQSVTVCASVFGSLFWPRKVTPKSVAR